MTWLSGWLKEIIMVVLLATFVDLILPSRSMERYVKLVLSLLILLTLLSPLIKLLTDAADIKLAGAFNRFNQQSAAGGGTGSLQQIMEQAKELKNQQQKQSLEWAAREIAAQMQEQIRKQQGGSAAEVQVVLGVQEGAADEAAAQNPYIKGVTVVLKPEDRGVAANAGKSQDPDHDIRVEPVTPVQVEVQIEPGGDAEPSEKASEQGELSEDDLVKAEAIKKMLGNAWGIEPETVVVQNTPSENRKL